MGFLSWVTGTDKYGAAQSALIAKHTFLHLSEDSKEQVRSAAYSVLEAGGYPPDMINASISKMGERELYCLYAMAMDLIDIKPALKGILYKDGWYLIKNPFIALNNAEKQINTAQFEIERNYNIHIELKDNSSRYR